LSDIPIPSQEVFSRIRDFADAVLVFVVLGQGWALFLMWRRLGEFAKRIDEIQAQRVEDAKETNRTVVSGLGSSREAITAQANATERLREAVDRLREPMEGFRTSIELLRNGVQMMHTLTGPRRPRAPE
jgi:hypothetical protein